MCFHTVSTYLSVLLFMSLSDLFKPTLILIYDFITHFFNIATKFIVVWLKFNFLTKYSKFMLVKHIN